MQSPSIGPVAFKQRISVLEEAPDFFFFHVGKRVGRGYGILVQQSVHEPERFDVGVLIDNRRRGAGKITAAGLNENFQGDAGQALVLRPLPYHIHLIAVPETKDGLNLSIG